METNFSSSAFAMITIKVSKRVQRLYDYSITNDNGKFTVPLSEDASSDEFVFQGVITEVAIYPLE